MSKFILILAFTRGFARFAGISKEEQSNNYFKIMKWHPYAYSDRRNNNKEKFQIAESTVFESVQYSLHIVELIE